MNAIRLIVPIASAVALATTSGCSLFRSKPSSNVGINTPVNPLAQPTDPMGGPVGPVGPGGMAHGGSGGGSSNSGMQPFGPGGSRDISTSPSPADLMFTSDEPFSTPASAVNVFGELDGFGPSVFSVAGKGGFQQHTFVDEGYDADPEISPDGQWLMFSSTRHSDHPDIYLQRIDGLAVTQLTADDGDDGFAKFSPDGKRVVFASNRAGNWDIYVMDVDGKNVEQITRSASNEIHPTFSPDGNRIVFCALGARSGQWELWTVDLPTGRRQMIGYGLFPDWSPRLDKDVIAFQRARQRGTRWFSAWTLELTEDDAKNVTEVAYSTNAAVICPKWNADGTRLTFCTVVDPNAAEGSVNKAQARGTTQDIWVVNADGTNRQRLTDGRGVNATPAWSRDGRIYFISDRGGSEAIWSVAGGRETGVASKPQEPPTPTASTDLREDK